MCPPTGYTGWASGRAATPYNSSITPHPRTPCCNPPPHPPTLTPIHPHPILGAHQTAQQEHINCIQVQLSFCSIIVISSSLSSLYVYQQHHHQHKHSYQPQHHDQHQSHQQHQQMWQPGHHDKFHSISTSITTTAKTCWVTNLLLIYTPRIHELENTNFQHVHCVKDGPYVDLQRDFGSENLNWAHCGR